MENLFRQFAEDLEWLAARFLAEDHGQLLEADDQPDGCEHAVHDGGREEVGEGPGAEQAKGDLHEAGHAPHCDGHAIGLQIGGGINAAGEAERLHGPEHDHD